MEIACSSPTARYVAHEAQAKIIIHDLVRARAWFACDPLPDDHFSFTVKEEPANLQIFKKFAIVRADVHTMCEHCDHFVEENILGEGEYYADDPNKPEGVQGFVRFVHLEDGEQEFDHDAKPHMTRTEREWADDRPDLFMHHPDDKVGPNSIFHNRRGKVDDNRYRVMGFATRKALTGAPSLELVRATIRSCRAFAAYKDADGVWQLYRGSNNKSQHDVVTVYVEEV